MRKSYNIDPKTSILFFFRSINRGTVLLCLFSAHFMLLNAQRDTTMSREAYNILNSRERIERSFTRTTFTPFGNNISNFVSNISLASSFKEGANGKAELKYTFEKKSNPFWLTVGAGIDQKIGEQSKDATPFDLNGLSAGSTVEFNIQAFTWKPILTRNSERNLNAQKVKFRSDDRPINRVLTSEDYEDRSIQNNLLFKHPWSFNFKAGFAKNDFTFTTDSVKFIELTESHLSPQLTAAFIKPLGTGLSKNRLLSISYTYSVNYSNADELSVITPLGTTSNFISKSVSLGLPKKETDHRLNLEYRANIGIRQEARRSHSLGLAPSATLGFDSKQLAVILPIYFINGVPEEGKPSGLQGGFKLGYLTSTKKGEIASLKNGFAAQLIITAPFDVFGNLE